MKSPKMEVVVTSIGPATGIRAKDMEPNVLYTPTDPDMKHWRWAKCQIGYLAVNTNTASLACQSTSPDGFLVPSNDRVLIRVGYPVD